MKDNIKTSVVSGFPGVGKSYYVNHGEGSDYMPQGFALDSDSSKFPKEGFPKNYIQHIKENMGKVKIIFVSSHQEVRKALVEENIDFTLCYPHKGLKLEYLKRYIDRGSPIQFIELLFVNWEIWIDDCFNQRGCSHKVMNKGEYLYNIKELLIK